MVRDVRSWWHSRAGGSRSARLGAWRSLAAGPHNAQVAEVRVAPASPWFSRYEGAGPGSAEAALRKLCSWLRARL